ncbi:MAG: hypothetical protein RLZ35_999, partial [Pseudomonadota bacterium]
ILNRVCWQEPLAAIVAEARNPRHL